MVDRNTYMSRNILLVMVSVANSLQGFPSRGWPAGHGRAGTYIHLYTTGRLLIHYWYTQHVPSTYVLLYYHHRYSLYAIYLLLIQYRYTPSLLSVLRIYYFYTAYTLLVHYHPAPPATPAPHYHTTKGGPMGGGGVWHAWLHSIYIYIYLKKYVKYIGVLLAAGYPNELHCATDSQPT